jgi:periplasmic protein TonB
VHYAQILIVMLILVASELSHAHAAPAMEIAFDPQAASHAPNPDASGKYHLGNGVSAPKLLFAPDPDFTDEARHKQVQGVTVLSLTVDISGNPQDVLVTRSMAEDVKEKYKHAAMGLDQKAVEAVKQYRFQPGQFQGKPVPVEIPVSVNFRLY